MKRQVFVEFTRPKSLFSFFSWMIRLVEKTPYSHVRLRWFSTSGEEIIYEASGSTVKLIGSVAQKDFPAEVVRCYQFELTPDQYKKMISLFRFASVSYGKTQIIGIAIAKCFGLKKNPLASGKKTQVCSELVAYFLKDVLGKEISPEQFDLIGPAGIEKIIKECYGEPC